MLLETVLSLIALALLVDAWVWHVRLASSLRDERRKRPLSRYPSVSVIRPVKGLDCEARENIRTALSFKYPAECETIFVLDDREDPSFSVLQEEIRDWVRKNPFGRARIVFCGEPPPGRTGKLNAMIAAYGQAHGEVIVFADSDIRPADDTLTRLIEALENTPGSGSSFGQVIVTSTPRTAGDVGYAIMINGLYAPAVYFSARKNRYRFPFIMGQVMALRREAITAVGGLESVDGQLVDDMYIGQLFHQAGFANVLTPVRLPIIHHDLPLKGFWKLFVRWISFSRAGLPGTSFKMISWRRGVVFWVGLLMGLGGAIGILPRAALLGFAAPLVIATSLNILHGRVGGAKLAWRHLWVSFAVIVVAPVVYLTILLGRKVTWRGRDYTLDLNARLAAQTVTPAMEPAPTDRRRIWIHIPPELDRRVQPQSA